MANKENWHKFVMMAKVMSDNCRFRMSASLSATGAAWEKRNT